MITFRDPPPLPARVQPRAVVTPVDGGSFEAPWRRWVAGMVESADASMCWRDPANVADNEWSYSAVPDKPFTVAVVHAADTVSRNADPTRDTLIVRW